MQGELKKGEASRDHRETRDQRRGCDPLKGSFDLSTLHGGGSKMEQDRINQKIRKGIIDYSLGYLPGIRDKKTHKTICDLDMEKCCDSENNTDVRELLV